MVDVEQPGDEGQVDRCEARDKSDEKDARGAELEVTQRDIHIRVVESQGGGGLLESPVDLKNTDDVCLEKERENSVTLMKAKEW